MVETIHNSFRIMPNSADVVSHAPPSRLRKYDLMLLDEGSQVDDSVWQLVSHAIAELSQRPVLGIAGDFQQLQPIKKLQGESRLQQVCRELEASDACIELKTIHRTKDPKLTAYLNHIRFEMPTRRYVQEYWGSKVVVGSLDACVRTGMQI